MRLFFVFLTLICGGVLSAQRYVPGYLLTEDVAAYSRCRGEVQRSIGVSGRPFLMAGGVMDIPLGRGFYDPKDRLKPIATDANFGPEADGWKPVGTEPTDNFPRPGMDGTDRVAQATHRGSRRSVYFHGGQTD